MSVKGINKKAVEHNLAHALKQAVIKNDKDALHKAADDVVAAGYELEDLKLLPGFFAIVCNCLLETGWTPKFNFEEPKEPDHE